MIEVREIHWDWEAELPSMLWVKGARKLKVRTIVEAHGVMDDKGLFMVRSVNRVVRHEVEPEDWKPSSQIGYAETV